MFKVGDEVVCVNASGVALAPLVQGNTYTVAAVGAPPLTKGFPLQLVEFGEVQSEEFWGFLASRFRKVERKSDSLSIEAFLTIKPGFEEPKRTNQPAKRKERAS